MAICRAVDKGKWTVANILRQANQPYTRWTTVKPAQLAEFQRYADPSWEARNGVVNQVACRVCGQLRHYLSTHLKIVHQMTVDDYDRRYPGALLVPYKVMLAHTVARNRVTLEEYVAAGAARYLTPAEMADHLQDHLYEKHHGIRDYVACRLCGFKCAHNLHNHLKTRHGCGQEQYHERFPGAWYQSLPQQEARSGRSRKNYHRMGHRPKGWKNQPADKKLIYMLLIEHPGINNAELGKLLDRTRLIRCPYRSNRPGQAPSVEGKNWERVLRDKKALDHGAATTYISKIRKLLPDDRVTG